MTDLMALCRAQLPGDRLELAAQLPLPGLAQPHQGASSGGWGPQGLGVSRRVWVVVGRSREPGPELGVWP